MDGIKEDMKMAGQPQKMLGTDQNGKKRSALPTATRKKPKEEV